MRAQRTAVPEEFSLDWFWRKLGLDDGETSVRDHVATEADGAPFDAEGVAAGLDLYDDLEALGALWNELGGQKLSLLVDGRPLGDYLRERKAILEERVKEPAMALSRAPSEPDYHDETPF